MVETGRIYCANHPDEDPEWECKYCRKWFCIKDVNPGPDTDKMDGLCPECGRTCRYWGPPPHTMTFYDALEGAFAYPFRGRGKYMVVFGSIALTIVLILGWFPVFGWLMALVGGGYYLAILQDVIRESAAGSEEMAEWPDWTSAIFELGKEVLGLIYTIAVSFLPLLVYMMFQGFFVYVNFDAFAFVLLIAGLIYFPMALISVAIGFSLVFRPAVIILSIYRSFKYYLVALIFISLQILFYAWAVETLIDELQFLGLVLIAMFTYYWGIVIARVLGLVYLFNAERLNWYSFGRRMRDVSE